MVEAGKLRHKIDIQKFTTAKDSYGEDIKTWASYHKTYSKIEPLRGKEYFDTQQIVPEVDNKITIRYKSGIAPTMRIVWGSRTYEIRSVTNLDERNIMLEFLAVENPTS
ncbi:hypothetical protein LCGC14_2116930 [marine sediment metagenome]|uniref:Phage head-tail adaptor n=1 Tax=marine sediment metagenome TaxID=412755 RepID=A0A0F9H1N3_9ZZZZ